MSNDKASAILRFSFCAGHRLLQHEGKCRHLHGHNWGVVVRVSGELDDCGRIVDFGELKRIVKGWVDESIDHGFILDSADSQAFQAVGLLPGQKVFLMDRPPSAENIAWLIQQNARRLLSDICKVEDVTVWESDSGGASSGSTS